MTKKVAILDYGSGNLRSAQRAVEHVGATVEITSDPAVCTGADGLLVPGVGAFAACMQGLTAVKGQRIIGERLAGGRPVLGICVGMQIMFERGVEFADGEHDAAEADPEAAQEAARADTDGSASAGKATGRVQTIAAGEVASTPGAGEWPGTVERLEAPVLPHMGWNTVEVAAGSELFAGLDADTRFYFVHSYGVRTWELDPSELLHPPKVSWTTHHTRFVSAVENGPLWATQFHPEKSGDAGLQLLENWVKRLG